uniref:CSC1/OSCA1-like 7TM region domain-containing protein n=2 Tax=Chaetoceros debilis TaxID=122233 RepID=A0A7S3QEH8_9STRA|mmetsp:Transcript_2937/g.4333  ORF Transcript_2937/g.4333 Transcript_2937/m.4333 type:complete len:1106 (-) Transcript_2937:123-3440(-)
MASTTAAAAASVQVPQWMIDFHNYRTSLFLTLVEPVIVYVVGPMEDLEESIIGTLGDMNMQSVEEHEQIGHAYNYEYENSQYSPEMEISEFDDRRKLGFLPNYVGDVSAFRETSMSFATLVMLFTIMTCVVIVFLSCFYHNQKTSPLFASPRRHRLPRLVPPPLPVDGTFSWIKVCFYMSDEEIINRVGFDALIFIRFHRLALRCILKMSIFSFLVLLPLNFTGGGHANASDLKGYVGSLLFTDFLRFSMANVEGGSPRLWVHCFAAYLLSGIVMRELVVEYNAFNNIRHRYMLSKEPHLRTVLVSNIPRHLRSPKKIRNYFKHVYPNAVKNVTMCQNLIHLEKMVARRTKILNKIEQEILILCRSEKRKLIGGTLASKVKAQFSNCGGKPLTCFEDMGLMDGAPERLTHLYGELESMNIMIQHEQERRARVMKKLDKMEAKVGRKDIDYILATPFLDKESQSSKKKRKEYRGKSGEDSFRIPSGAGKGFDYVKFDKEEDKKKKKNRGRPFAKAKQAIKRYSRSVFDASLIGRPVRRYEEPKPMNVKSGDDDENSTITVGSSAIENRSIEVTDKAFVEMKTFTASTIAIQSMHSSKPGAMEVKMAPEPRDILWKNIYVSKGAKKTRSFIGDTVAILLISFYVVPVALISLLVSESALISISPRLEQLDQASVLFSTIIALVQPICLVVIQQLLPPLFMQISKAEGMLSFSEVQMKAFSRYFMFQVLNVFLVTAIAGSIFDTLAIIIENPESMFEMLGNSLPRMSSFFITLVLMKTFLGLGVELVRLFSIVQSLLRYPIIRNATLRMKKNVIIGMRAIDDPGWFPYHKVLAQDMLVVVIGVVFAIVAPLVLFPCALFCLFSRIIWTHHHLYIFESVFESGGQFWPKIFRRFVFGLIIAQMTITGQFILKEARHEAYATIALMFFTYVFLRTTRARYDAASSTLPLEVATIMDITVAQENEAKKGLSGKNVQPSGDDKRKEKLPKSGDDEEYLLSDFDPYEHAYCQPALRSNPEARPEQPVPPGQLGKEESLFDSEAPNDLNAEGYNPADDKATVRLKSLNERDRAILNNWWNEQVDISGRQDFFSVLMGEESGTLRLGRRQQKSAP